jgi:predicted ATPase
MKRYILTGTPGCGKTAILRQLELAGFGVIEEAATDVIALRQAHGVEEPWREPDFVDAIVQLQRLRLERAFLAPDPVQFHDRCVICTRALAAYLEVKEPDGLTRDVRNVLRDGVFDKKVFFIRNLGFVRPTAARRISFEESLIFERMHEKAYQETGFELLFVEAGTVAERVAAILGIIGQSSLTN